LFCEGIEHFVLFWIYSLKLVGINFNRYIQFKTISQTILLLKYKGNMSVQDSEMYRKLQQRLDTLPIGFPATKSGVELRILKALFTPKEAKIAVKMSFIPESVEKIYRRVKKIVASKDELREILDKMYHNGAINLQRTDVPQWGNKLTENR